MESKSRDDDDDKDTQTNKRVWGFSAQDLASKTDNIVSEGGEDKFTEPWTHDSKSLEGFFIQAIKELQLKINTLESEIKHMKDQRRIDP